MAEHFRRDRSALVLDVQRLEERLHQAGGLRDAVAAVMKRLLGQP